MSVARLVRAQSVNASAGAPVQRLAIADEHGKRRLDDPNDFVRLEIEAALARKVRVIPILVEGANMPRADELPPSLAALARRQALELSPSRFDFDTSRLFRVLDKTLAEVRAAEADVAVGALRQGLLPHRVGANASRHDRGCSLE